MAGHLWRSGRRRLQAANSDFAVSEGHGVHGGAYARQCRREFDCESEYLAGRAVHANLSDIKSNSSLLRSNAERLESTRERAARPVNS